MVEKEEEPETLKPLESSAKTADAFAKALQMVGDNGRWQWEMTFITAFCGVFTAMQNFGAGNYLSWIFKIVFSIT